MRLRNTAGTLEELGEDAQGAAESITKLQTQLLNLTGGKVDIMLNSTEFKSTYEILTEISQVWGDLTDKAQADITRLVAGVRQGNIFDAILKNMDDAASTVEASLNSASSAARENEKWLQSLEGKLSRFAASFQITANKLVNSGLIMFFIDAGRYILDFFGAFDGAIGKIVGVPAAIFAVVAALKALELTKIGGAAVSMFNDMKDAANGVKAYGAALNAISALSKAGEVNLAGLAAATQGLSQKQIAAIAIKNKQILTSKLTTQVALAEQLQTIGLTAAKANETAAQILNTSIKGKNAAASGAQAGANLGLLASIKAVTTGLVAQTAAFFASPLGMVTVVVGSVLAIGAAFNYVSKINEKFLERQNEIIRSLDTNIQKWEEEKTQLQNLRIALINAKNDKQKLWAISKELNDVIGETPGLINGESAAWDIANEKLRVQIQLLDEYMVTAQNHKVDAHKNIFSSQRLAYNMEDGMIKNALGRMTQQDVINEMEKTKQELVDAYRIFDDEMQSYDDILAHETYGTSMMVKNMQGRVARYEEFLMGLVDSANAVFSDYVRQQNIGQMGEHLVNDFVRNAVFSGKNLVDINEGVDQVIEAYRRINLEQDKFITARRSGQDSDPYLENIQNEIITLIELLPYASEELENFGNTLARALNVPPESDILSGLGFQVFIDDAQKAIDAFEQFADEREKWDGALSSKDRQWVIDNDLNRMSWFDTWDASELSEYVDMQFSDASEAVRNKCKQIVTAYQEGTISIEQAKTQLELSFGKQILDATILKANDDLQTAFANADGIVDGLVDSYKELAETFNDISESMNKISKAQEEMRENGQLSLDTAYGLLAANESYGNVLTVVDGKIILAADAEERLTEAKINAMRQSLELAVAQAEMAIQMHEASVTSAELAEVLTGEGGVTSAYKLVAQSMAFVNTLLSGGSISAAKDAWAETGKQLNATFTTIELNSTTSMETLQANLVDAQNRLDIFNASVENVGQTINGIGSVKPNTDFIQALVHSIKRYQTVTHELEKQQWAEIAKGHLSEIKKLWEEGSISLQEYLYWQSQFDSAIGYMDAFTESVQSLQSAYTMLTSAIDEFTEYGDLQIETVQKLIELDSEYLDLISFAKGKIVLNTQAVDERISAIKDEMTATVQANVAEEIRGIILEDVKDKTNGLVDVEDEHRKKLIEVGAQAITTANDLGTLAAASLVATQAMQEMDIDLDGLSSDALSKIDAAIARGNTLLSAINAMGATAERAMNKGSASSRSSKDEYKEAAEKEFKELKYRFDKRLISEANYLNRLNALNDKFYKDKAKYLDDYRKYELEVINGLQKMHEQSLDLQLYVKTGTGNAGAVNDYEQQIELYKILQADLHAQANSYREMGYEETDIEIRELGKKWADFQNRIVEITGQGFIAGREQLGFLLYDMEASKNYEAQIQIYKEFQQSLQDQADKYRELGYDATDVEILELQKKWQEYYDKIKDTIAKSYEHERSQLEFKLTVAQESLNFNEQFDLYRQFQESLLNEASRYREMGLREEDAQIQELLKKYRAYGSQIVSVYDEMFKKEREAFDRHLSKLDFNISITSDTQHAEQEQLLNQKLENRLALSQNLLNQLVRLRMETDANVRSTEVYKNLMYELESAYDANIKAIYDLVSAHKQMAESQISDVRDLQEKVISMLRARYQKEKDLLKDNYDLKKKQIDDEKNLLKKRYDVEIGYIDEMLKTLNKQWAEEDKRKRKQQDEGDIHEIQRKINELKLAAATGDSEAISRIEDLQKQLAEKMKKMNDDAENDRRDDIRNELNDQKDALRDKYDLDMKYLDKRQEMLDKEFEAEQELLDMKLKNANLYAEAKKVLDKGVNEQLIHQLHEYEDEFGEGMGILGDYVKLKLTQQILDAGEALKNLAHNVRIATDSNLFNRIINGENITVKDIFAEMFNTTNLDSIMDRINQAINDIDFERIKKELNALGDEFNNLINGNFDLNNRLSATSAQMRSTGWDNFNGVGADYRVNDAAGNRVTIKVTPVLENGRVLTPDELQKYVDGQIDGAQNLLKADNHKLIVATSLGWDDDAFIELDSQLESIKQRYTDLWLSMQDNLSKFVNMSDEGLFNFIEQQFGNIPVAAKNAIADALRELGSGKVGLEEALENIFNMPIENVSEILNTNLTTLSREQIQTIEQMRENSIAWEKATTDAEKARLEAENERLALAQGWFKDATTNTWYLDEEKTQRLFEVIDEFQVRQVEYVETLIDMYDEDYKKFDELQKKKLHNVKKLHDEIIRSNTDMMHILHQNMQRFTDNVSGVLNAIAQAINELILRLNTVNDISVNTQITTQTKNTGGNESMPRFATGGLNREAGIRFLDPNEQVLTAEQTKAFSDLVFGLGSEGMKDIADAIKKGSGTAAHVQGKSLTEASFNFYGSITQEAMPQVKQMLNDAIYELKGEIPKIVAIEQKDSLRRIGGR